MFRLLLPAALLLAALGCSKSPPRAQAFKVETRSQLVGGQRALGDVGDFKLTNGLVHAVIQDVGTSRGFGAFGGSLIDVDLVRGAASSPVTGVQGKDGFTEMFPSFFLQAIEPKTVEVASDGSDGGPAIIKVSGRGAEFISLTKPVNDTVMPQVPLDFTVEYILEPGKQYLKIVVTLTNADKTQNATFPLPVPFGFVTLLGEGQRLFVPGEPGFDMRFFLEDVAYKRPSQLDALPGAVASMWATEGHGVSYALAASRRGAGYLGSNPTFYPDAKGDSMLIPISSSSFLGSMWARPPPTITPGKTFQYSAYLAIGAGDIASAQKVIYAIDDDKDRQPTVHGMVSGRVIEAETNQPLEDVSVVLEDEKGHVHSQARTIKDGLFSAPVPPGKYRPVAVDKYRTVARGELVEVAAGGTAHSDVQVSRAGNLKISVRDDLGRALPSKISVEAIYEEHPGASFPREFLYELRVGSRPRPSDLDADGADANSRRYLERVFFLGTGNGTQALKPGTYTVFASRGIEYSLEKAEVEVKAGETTEVNLVLKHEMKTTDWVSGDFHVHSVNSVDSDMALPDRVISYAVEGVDYISSTDHNYVSDFAPTIENLRLSDWLSSSVGLELTTLEMGHFNAFPLVLQPGPITHGSFSWFRRPPGELFAQLRGLGADPQKTIVQVNHPRDSVLGYFNAFNVSTYTMKPLPADSLFTLDRSPLPDGSKSPYHYDNWNLDFDAIEVFNGKRPDVMFSYRMPPCTGTGCPSMVPPGNEPNLPACPLGSSPTETCLPAPGEVLHKVVDVPQQDGSVKKELQPAYAGVMEDWFTLLKMGRKYTATGNSDSHSATAEAGLPRTYMWVGGTANGSMRGLAGDAVMDALRTQKVVVTNGPFVTMTVNEKPIGSEVVAPDGKVSVHIHVEAASWVDVRRVRVRRGGPDQGMTADTLETIDVPASTDLVRLDVTKSYGPLPDDSFIVLEVEGDRHMWPVYTPYEFPSLQISDAVAVIGGSLGLGSKFGKYKPEIYLQVKPYAFTNPIWVRRSLKQSLVVAKPVLPLGGGAEFQPRTISDLRRLFGAFHSDPE